MIITTEYWRAKQVIDKNELNCDYTQDKNNFAVCGGKTIVTIHWQGMEFQGIALCSLEDTFNKKVGYKIALKRALEKWLDYQIELRLIETSLRITGIDM